MDADLTIAIGLKLAQVCALLLAQRWEEGWQRPVEDWQEQLTAVLPRSPCRQARCRAARPVVTA